MPDETVSPADMSVCDCVACRKRRMAEVPTEGRLHNYSATPRNGWTPRRTADPADATAPTFGVELETAAPTRVADLPGRPDRPYVLDRTDPAWTAYNAWTRRNREHHERQARASLTVQEACAVASPRGLWLPCSDGSVTGPEYKSQPATLAYWRSQRAALGGMFRTLLHGGFRSHDGDTAGAHVNIGADAFGIAPRRYSMSPDETAAAGDHLYRFTTLLVSNERWTTRLAGRTHNSMHSWSGFSSLRDADQRRRLCRDWAANGGAYHARYSVVNMNHADRIEVRAPRGTLRVDRFMARLEWMAAAVEYTRDPHNAPTPAGFTRWVQARPTEYPDLLAYMTERFPGRFDGPDGGGAPRPVAFCSSAHPTAGQCSRLPGHRGDHRGATGSTWTDAMAAAAASAPAEPVADPYRVAASDEQVCANSDPNGSGMRCERQYGHMGQHAALLGLHDESRRVFWPAWPEPMVAEFDAAAATDTWPTPIPSASALCTCGYRWGEHTGSLCPSGDRAWAEHTGCPSRFVTGTGYEPCAVHTIHTVHVSASGRSWM